MNNLVKYNDGEIEIAISMDEDTIWLTQKQIAELFEVTKQNISIVKLYKYLCDEKKEYVLSKQLLRCGTSIGANVNEAQAAQSKADFISKLSISSKEARETNYWINLLIETKYLNIEDTHVKSLKEDTEEIIKLLTSIIKSSQDRK